MHDFCMLSAEGALRKDSGRSTKLSKSRTKAVLALKDSVATLKQP